MVRQHHRLKGHEFERTPGDSGVQRSLVCCSPWGHRVRHNLATEHQLPQSLTPIMCSFPYNTMFNRFTHLLQLCNYVESRTASKLSMNPQCLQKMPYKCSSNDQLFNYLQISNTFHNESQMHRQLSCNIQPGSPTPTSCSRAENSVGHTTRGK